MKNSHNWMQKEVLTLDMWDLREQVFARVAEIACWEQMEEEMAKQQQEYADACIHKLWEECHNSYCLRILLQPFAAECVEAGRFSFGDEKICCRVLQRIDCGKVRKGYLYALRVPKQLKETETPQSLLQQYYLEAFQVACMDVARDWIQDYLQNVNSTAAPCVCSPSIGPGFYGMKLEDVPKLLKLVDAKQIGITWKHGCMHPQMSIIGIYLISFDRLLPDEKDCRDCIGGSDGCSFCRNNRNPAENIG